MMASGYSYPARVCDGAMTEGAHLVSFGLLEAVVPAARQPHRRLHLNGHGRQRRLVRVASGPSVTPPPLRPLDVHHPPQLGASQVRSMAYPCTGALFAAPQGCGE